MSKTFVVKCGFPTFSSIHVTVEADTLHEALQKAVQEAGDSDDWEAMGEPGETFVDAVGEVDADQHAYDPDACYKGSTFESALPIPLRHRESGEVAGILIAKLQEVDAMLENPDSDAFDADRIVREIRELLTAEG